MSSDSTGGRDHDLDALDVLRLPTSAESPSPQFAARLRRRLEEIIMPTPPATTTDASPVLATVQSVTAYLAVHDARAAIEWYGDVFGAELAGEPIIMPDGHVGHAELRIGGSTVFLADESPDYDALGPRTRGGPTSSFVVAVRDADEVYARAVERGATGERPPSDQFYGRAGWFSDPFGHRWNVQTPLADTTARHATQNETFAATELWNELGYYTISVPDPERARRFYNGLFGWDLPAPQQSPGFYGMHNSSTKLPMGFHAPTEEDGPGPVIYFRVHDVQLAADRVRELGGEVLSINVYASGGGAVCRDDQGVQFHLWQPAEGY